MPCHHCSHVWRSRGKPSGTTRRCRFVLGDFACRGERPRSVVLAAPSVKRVFVEALAHGVYTAVWLWGTIVMFSVFAVFETWALIDGKPNQDTYSAHVWAWLATRRGWHGPRAVVRVFVILGLLWLAEHFGFGWF